MTKEDIFQFPKAKWALPFFASHSDFCFRYVDLLNNELNTYDFIHSVYGSPDCIMNGGHAGRNIDEFIYLNEIDEWNKRGISVWLTFTNYKATLNDIKNDVKCVNMLDKLENNNLIYGTKNGVILANYELIRYIKYQYPTLKLISSVVMQAKDNTIYSNELYKDLLNTFDTACILYKHNNHINDIIDNLSDNADRYEILVNNICNYNCPIISKCYDQQCLRSLKIANSNIDDKIGPLCPTTRYKNNNKLTPIEENTILDYKTVKRLEESGFILKLASRAYNISSFRNMIYGWMININYRDIVENTLYDIYDSKLYEV